MSGNVLVYFIINDQNRAAELGVGMQSVEYFLRICPLLGCGNQTCHHTGATGG